MKRRKREKPYPSLFRFSLRRQIKRKKIHSTSLRLHSLLFSSHFSFSILLPPSFFILSLSWKKRERQMKKSRFIHTVWLSLALQSTDLRRENLFLLSRDIRTAKDGCLQRRSFEHFSFLFPSEGSETQLSWKASSPSLRLWRALVAANTSTRRKRRLCEGSIESYGFDPFNYQKT